MTDNIEVLIFWIRVVGVIAAVATTSFPVIYSFAPWRSRPVGRVMMYQGIAFAVAIDISLLFSFWRPHNILITFWIQAAMLTGIAVSTSLLSWQMWRINFPKKRKAIKVQLTSPVYNFLKQLALVYLSAFGTLYFALSGIWGLPAADKVTGTVLAVEVFLGLVLGISKRNYDQGVTKYDGVMNVRFDPESDKKVYHLQVNGDLDLLGEKKEVVLKVLSDS